MRFLTAAAILALIAHPATAQDAKPIEEQIGGGGRPVGANWSRSPVIAENGMAATAHPLATQVALDTLKAGGSAVWGGAGRTAAQTLLCTICNADT